MRAVVVPEYGDVSVLELQDRTVDSLGSTQVRVDVRAAGVNFADVDQRRGRYRDGPDPPFVPGLEGAGVIAATGSEVDRWETGDEVTCFFPAGGGYAETAITDAAYVFPKPSSLSFAAAGGMLVQTFTAHNALFEWGGLSAEDTVVINAAAGGVGSVAVQFAATAGATVVGTASTDDKREFASDCGADYTIDYTTESVVTAVEEITDGAGADLVLDGVGGEAFADGLEALRAGGTAVTYGVASGDVTTLAVPRLFYQNKSVVGYHLMNGMEALPEQVLAAESRVFDLVESGDVTVTVEERFPLTAAADVHAAIENRETRGRVVLEP